MRQNKERGMASLLALLVACAVGLILAAALMPNAIRAMQTMNSQAAAATLYRINAAEQAVSASSAYGGYMAPSDLAKSDLVNGVSACAPNLITGADAQEFATAGYDNENYAHV